MSMSLLILSRPRVDILCAELGITRQTLYRYVDLQGRLRLDGENLLHARARMEIKLPVDSVKHRHLDEGHGDSTGNGNNKTSYEL